MFLLRKKILEQINIFFRIFCIACTIQGSLFSERYSHTTQIAAVNERSFFYHVSCQKAEEHTTQRKREITEMTFLSGKVFVEMLKSMLSISLLLLIP